MFLLKRSTGQRFSVQSMIHPKPIWSFHSVENWFHSFFIYVFLINPRSRTWTFHERSETLIHKLRRAVQAMMMHLMLNSRHSACLERIRLRPFNIPYAFSVTTLAPHNLLLFIRGIFVVWFNELKKPRAPTAAFKNRLL